MNEQSRKQMILPIYTYGQPVLRKETEEIDADYPNLKQIIQDMWDTLGRSHGVGLAAPQVGILRRIAVVEVEPGEVIELINPKIIAFAGEQEEQEGCLSIPGRWGITHRPTHVTVRATNRNGEAFEVSGSDLLARALCHEIDHLDGKLFIDHVVRYVD